MRWPPVALRTQAFTLGLPPGSRLRRALLRRLAKQAFEAWNRGDWDALNLKWTDAEDVETHVFEGGGLPIGFDPVYYGPEGHCRAMQSWNEAWRSWEGEIVEIVEEGSDQIVVIARIHAEGGASGIPFDAWGAARYTFRDSRIARVDGAFAADRDEALAAIMLRPSPTPAPR